jgi:hypothetical protein
MNTKQIKEFLPLGVLSLIGFASIIQVLLTNYIFDYRQYIGLSLLMVCGIFFFTNKKLYRYFLGITLILGTFNLIAFSTYIFAFFLIFFPLQILPFVVFILYLIIYRKRIFGLFFRSFQKSEEEEKEYYNRKLKRFKEKFAELTDAEIDYRLNQELVPEAKQALIEIKKNRN